MSRTTTITLIAFIVCLMTTSCYKRDAHTDRVADYGERQTDSIAFVATHHYSTNYNFVVKAPELMLLRRIPSADDAGTIDTLRIKRSDHIVVADIHIGNAIAENTDSVWVQVARDQYTFGWISERELLANVVPDDPISQFISTFSDTHLLIFLVVISIIAASYIFHIIFKINAKMVHFNDINSFYPALLALTVAAAATTYQSIQMFEPDMWQHFYYHPSLNPFVQPPLLAVFLCMVWTIVLVAIAAVDEVFHTLSLGEAFHYLGGLVGICAINYIVFSISTIYYIGYVLLAAYITLATGLYLNRSSRPYICGRCGAALHAKGRCPECGAMNT